MEDDYDDFSELEPQNSDINDIKHAVDIESEYNELTPVNSDYDTDDGEDYKKLASDDINTYINKYHPECFTKNSHEINLLSQVTRINNIIVDDNHKSNPILTKYEKTKILGLRTKQLNSGCDPYLDVPSNIIDNYLIAQLELKEKKIPIIIRRPISNDKFEYWKLEDLEQIN